MGHRRSHHIFFFLLYFAISTKQHRHTNIISYSCICIDPRYPQALELRSEHFRTLTVQTKEWTEETNQQHPLKNARKLKCPQTATWWATTTVKSSMRVRSAKREKWTGWWWLTNASSEWEGERWCSPASEDTEKPPSANAVESFNLTVWPTAHTKIVASSPSHGNEDQRCAIKV